MLNVVLYQPEIPQNAGNIARTCAATGARLHMIRPLGFMSGGAQMKRAGLDYWDSATITFWDSWIDFENSLTKVSRVICFTTKVAETHFDFEFQDGDYLLFGPETRGLPMEIIEKYLAVTIPMVEGTRSLNLGVSVGIGLYEAIRKVGI